MEDEGVPLATDKVTLGFLLVEKCRFTEQQESNLLANAGGKRDLDEVM